MTKALPLFSFTERGEALVQPLRTGARLAFSLTVILIPCRFRFILASRPQPPIYRDFTDFLLYASDIALLATLILWFFSLLIKPRQIKVGPLFITLPLAGVLAASLLSTFTSVDIPLSIYHFIRLVLLAGFYLYILNEVNSLRLIAVPAAWQILIQSLVGVAQYLVQGSIGLKFLGEWELDPAWSGVSVVWAEGVRSLRAYGLADHPNILGGSLVFGLILLAGWAIKPETRRSPWITSIFSLGLVTVLLTFSRSAWLALIAGLLFFTAGLRQTRQVKALSTWFSLAGAGILLLLPFIWQNAGFLGVRLNVEDSFTQITIEQRSLSERRESSDAANHLFSKNALDGVGLGAYPTALLTDKPAVPYNFQPPHVTLLEAAVETGIFGAFFYFLLLAAPWLVVWLNRERIHFSLTFLAVSGALAAITVVGFFDYYPWLLMPGRLWQTLIWGFWGAIYLQSTAKADPA